MENSNIKYKVSIDGKENILTYVSHSHGSGYQYNTENNSVSHRFPFPLGIQMVDIPFKVNGHTYIIKSKP